MLTYFDTYFNCQLNTLEKVDAFKQIVSKRKLSYENSNFACICGLETVTKIKLFL